MRVAYILKAFPTSRETFIINEIADLQRRGVEVDIFPWDPRDQNAIIHPEVKHNYLLERTHYFRYRHLLEVVFSPWCWWLLCASFVGRSRWCFCDTRQRAQAAWIATLLRRHGHKHVHAHNMYNQAAAVAAMAGATLSFTVHSYAPGTLDDRRRGELRRLIQGARAVIAVSEFAVKGLRSVAGAQYADRVHLVRCGIDPAVFSPSLKKEKRYDAICVAGFGPTKGIDILIEAAKLLRERDDSLRLIHVGGGLREVAEPYERQIAESDVGKVLTFAGAADSDQVRSYLSQSVVSVLPCIVTDDGHMDGLPVALMEAAAMELPLVSTDVAGIPELVIDGVTGIVVPQRDPRALADAIQTLLRDEKLRERLGKAARERVLEEFTREMNGDRLLAVLRPFIEET